MIPNNKNQPLSFEWQKTIREILDIADQLEYGEIVIKIQCKKPILTEYVIKRKPTDTDEFKVTVLGD